MLSHSLNFVFCGFYKKIKKFCVKMQKKPTKTKKNMLQFTH